MSTPTTTWAAAEDNIGGHKVDDRVRMFRNASGHDGENGTVRALDRDHGWRIWVHPDGAPYGLAVRMDPDDLERIVLEHDLPDATPAPLDLSKSAPQPGDTLVWTNSGIEVRVTELTPAAVVFAWSNGAVGQLPWSEWFNYLQPAPKPEWKPGQVAVVVQGGDPGAGVDDHEYRAALQIDGTWVRLAGEAATAAPISVRPLVVIDPVAVDVDALAEALRREWSGKDLGVTFSWDDIARTLLTELGIEVAR